MRHPWLFALPFASHCHLYAFGFPSVSPFWGASNPDWLNELRSDYPLNSTCIKWSYFDRGRHRNAVFVSLPSNDSGSLNRRSRGFPFLADGRCASFYAFIHTLGLCAAGSHATSCSSATVRGEWFVEPDSGSAFRRACVCCPLEPLSFAVWRVSHSGQHFVMLHSVFVRGVADQYHKPSAERADSPRCFTVDLRALSCELRRNRKEPNMCQSRGAIRFEPLFTTADIGLRPEASVEHVVKAFLSVGEALAARWIEMPRGILLLQSVPDEPASGAIYLYDRERRIFYFVSFLDGRDDVFTATEFDDLVVEYDLVSCAANPSLFSHCLSKIEQA